MIRFAMTHRLAKSLMQKPFGPAAAAGLAIWLAAAPASASFFGFPEQPPAPQHGSWNWWEPRPQPAPKPPAKVQRRPSRHEREVEVRRPMTKGPYQIIVEIGKQQVELYGEDGLIERAPISTGMPGHPTPMGVFSVLSKARWHQSNIYSGAPMPFMQRITWSGIALHAGPRPGYPASHGCIRLPEDFAIRLFHTTKVHARVIVTREPTAPVEIKSAKLFVPKPPADATVAMASAGDPSKTAVSLAARTVTAAAKPAAVASDAPKPMATPSAPATASDVATAADTATTGDVSVAIPLPPAAPKMASGPARPISVFVSLKQRRVFVRQGFDELFDLPVTIADPDRPIGTHVYTAMALTDGGKGMRWNVITIPSSYRRHVEKRRHGRKTVEVEEPAPKASTAAEALDRLTLPQEALAPISAMLVPGSSLIVSDNPLSDETDADTGFIVLTR
jgi:L,D-transpeptidase catalytic domain